MGFNPRAPCGARLPFRFLVLGPRGFNPRAPCGARQQSDARECPASVVSTHAPRAGRDRRAARLVSKNSRFQPTRPVRGATGLSDLVRAATGGFNPRAPCGARQLVFARPSSLHLVSTHAPRAGRDVPGMDRKQSGQSFNPRAPCGARQASEVPLVATAKFQPTRPVRGATR